MPHIIALAGPIGSGKSTMASLIAALLEDAAVLHYDSYEEASRRSPDDVIRWMKDGADFNAFVLPDLVRDLAALREGIPVT
ncbi:MAG TPA: uridine kinase, partial [Deltaproteobacteria bacterium]|nr:uridine kinase [Deltaproteobacteria bacterium]